MQAMRNYPIYHLSYFQVKALTVHPTSRYFVTASSDRTWAFYDVEAGSCLAQVKTAGIQENEGFCHNFTTYFFCLLASTNSKTNTLFSCIILQVSEPSLQSEGFSCASFHPDGLILGTGAGDSLVRIWDVKSQVRLLPLLHCKNLLANSHNLLTSSLRPMLPSLRAMRDQ